MSQAPSAPPAVPSASAPPADGLPMPQRRWSMWAILLGIALSVLDDTIVNLALPDIGRSFSASAAQSVWIVNAYQLPILALLLPFAQWGQRLGYRRIYLGGLALFTVASIACVFAPSLLLLAAARALLGVGAAGMMSVNPALIRLTYPSAVLGRGIALNSVVVAVSAVAGPSIAALVLSVASWPWLFVVQLPLCLLVAVLGRALPGRPSPSAPLPQAADVVLNILMFTLVFVGARELRAEDASGRLLAWGFLAAGLATGFVYVRRQFGRQQPLFPVDLLGIPVFALSICTSVTAFAAQSLAFIALPFLLLEGHGRSHLEAGLVFTAWPVGIMLAAPIAGRLIARVRAGLLAGTGLALLAFGLLALCLLPEQASSWVMAAGLALCGAGFGFFQSPNNHAIVTSAPLPRAGAASGMLGTARLGGQSLGAVLLALVFGVAGVRAGGPALALGVAAAMAAASSLFSLLRLRT